MGTPKNQKAELSECRCGRRGGGGAAIKFGETAIPEDLLVLEVTL